MTNAAAIALFRLVPIGLSLLIRTVILYVLVTNVIASVYGRNATLLAS